MAVAVSPNPEVSTRHWFVAYGLFLLVSVSLLLVLLQKSPWAWSDWTSHFLATFVATPAVVKVLLVMLYLSVCTTLVPLPTGWIVAGMAMREVAIAPDVWSVTLVVGLTGAIGSTLANLNDYHVWTWIFRSRRAKAIQAKRWYATAERWFARSPFWLVTVFSLVPVPVDVIRLLAISYRYPRLPFAAANFIGRFGRYALFAFATYWLNLGLEAPIALLAFGAVLVLGKVGLSLLRRQ